MREGSSGRRRTVTITGPSLWAVTEVARLRVWERRIKRELSKTRASASYKRSSNQAADMERLAWLDPAGMDLPAGSQLELV
jgi:hypothetical protein